MKPVLGIHYPGCVPQEIIPVLHCLQRLQGKVETVAASPTRAICAEYRAAGVRRFFSFREIVGSEYSVVLIPGGDPHSLVGDREIDRILKEANDSGACV